MKILIENYCAKTYTRWRIKEEKAGKDIVGEEYELMRAKYWSQLGYSAKSEKIADYNADLVVRDSKNRIVAIEEDKAHYVDSCFLDRFMMNAARVFQHYLDSGTLDEEIPFVILSSMTKYSLFGEKFDRNKKMFSKKIQKLMKEKMKYFPLCDHDRVRANKYFKEPASCFSLDKRLIEKQSNFVNNILRGV
tara:strand:- start:840 stop:1412 length:573 start_codon:yes stop_codon:yes gene_type:complete